MPRRNITTTAELVARAAALVAEVGPDRLRLADVARACDISIGTLYNHMPSKEHLLEAVSVTAEDIVIATMNTAAPQDRPLLPALPALARALLAVPNSSPLVRVLLRAAPTHAVHAQGEAPHVRAWIAARITTAQAVGEVGPCDPDLVAHLAHGLVRAALPLATRPRSPDGVAEHLSRGLSGLLPPP